MNKLCIGEAREPSGAEVEILGAREGKGLPGFNNHEETFQETTSTPGGEGSANCRLLLEREGLRKVIRETLKRKKNKRKRFASTKIHLNALKQWIVVGNIIKLGRLEEPFRVE